MQNNYAQVNVTSAGLQNFCIEESYISIPPITISETISGDFTDASTTPRTYIIAAPPNFEFDPSFGTVNESGDDISFIDIAVQPNQIRVIYVDEGNNPILESFSISNIRVRAINAASGPLDLVRTGGTAIQTNNMPIDDLEHAVFQSFMPPNAGNANNPTICVTETSFDLFNALTGEQGGGSWTDDDATGALSGNIFNASSAGVGSFDFTYQVSGPNCADATETVTITVEEAVSAGNATNRNICISNDNFNLFTTLTGFDTGGTWSDDDASGQLLGNTLDATGLTPGSNYDFTYSINGIACTDSETVTITIDPLNNAGTANAPIIICETETSYDLFDMLSGEDAGGSWNNDDGATGFSVSTLNASTTLSGTYNFTYTTVSSGCSADSETVTITVASLPQANVLNEEICDDGVGSPTENTSIDLVTDYNTLITSSSDVTITWHTGTPATGGNQQGNSTTSTPTITDGSIYYARIVNNTTLCESEGSITFQLNQLPDAIDFSYELCEESTGANAANIDLTTYENDISNSAPGVNITWYNDAALNFPVFTPTNQEVSSGTEYFAKIVNNLTSCENTAKIDFDINSLPSAPTTANINNNFCVGEDATAISVTAISGTDLKWYNSSDLSTQVALGSTPTIADLGISTASSGTFKRFVTQTDAESCESAALEININILDAPGFDPIPTNISVCSGELINIDFTTIAGTDNITWISDNTLVGNPASGTDNLNFLSAQNTTSGDLITNITVSAINEGCSTPVTSVFSITLSQTPSIPSFFPPVTVCADNSSFDLTSINLNASPAGGTYTYSGDGITGTLFNAQDAGVGIGVQVVDVTYETLDGCITNQSINLLEVIDNPSAEAGSNDEICSNSVFDLALANPSVLNNAGIVWSSAGDGSFSDASILEPVYTPGAADITAGSVILTLTATGAASCVDASDQLTLTITPEPTADAGANDETCVNTAFTVSDAAVTNASAILWTIDTGNGTLTNETTETPTYNPVAADEGTTVILTLTADGNGSCIEATDTKEIIITPAPTADAGANDETCVNTTFTVSDAAVTNASAILWTIDTGNGTLTNETTETPTYNPVAADAGTTVILTLTADGNGSCAQAIASKDIIIKPVAEIIPISDIILCPAESQASIPFSADVTGGSFSWNVTNFSQLGLASGSGTGDFPAFTAQANATGGNINSEVTISYTVNSCISINESFTITTKPTPIIDDISDLQVCPGENVNIAFNANTLGEVFNWDNDNNSIGVGLDPSGSGNINFNAGENLTGSPIVSNFTYSAILNDCESVTKSFSITLNPEPVINPITDIEVCSFDQIQTSFGSNVATADFIWTNNNTATGIPASGTGDIDVNALENLTGADVVSTIQVKGAENSCEGEFETFTVTVKPKPVITPLSDIEVCSEDIIPEIVFADNSGDNSTISWTATNSSNIGLPTNSGTGSIPEFTAAQNSGTSNITSTITVTSSWDGCESDQHTFRIILRPTPLLNAIADISSCGNEPILTNFTNSLGSITNYIWTNDSPEIGLPTSGNGNLDFTTAENISGLPIIATITVTPFNAECVGPNQEFTITLNPTPQISEINDIAICSEEFVSIPFNVDISETNLFISNSNPAIVVSDPVISNNAIEFTSSINTSGTDMTGVFELSSTKDGCTSVETFVVTLKNKPVVNPEADEQELCAMQNVGARTFSHSSGTGNFFWEITNPELIGDGSSVTGTDNFPGFELAENLTGVSKIGYVKYFSESNGCLSEKDSFKITLNPSPVVIIEDFVFCPGDFENIEFAANIPSGTEFFWTNIDNNTTIGLNNTNGNTFSEITPNGFTATNPSRTEDNIATIAVYGIKDGCQGPTTTFRIIVKPNPIIEIKYENICDINNGVKLDFSSTYDDLESDSIISYNWTIINDPTLAVENDTVIFTSSGRKDVRLEVNTALGCTFINDYVIEVWNLEIIDFSIENIAISQPGEAGTRFIPIITPSLDSSIVSFSYKWNFGDVVSGADNVSSLRNPTHNYQNPGGYIVTLEITGNGISTGAIGSCSLVKTDTINIIESIDSFPYFIDFEDNDANWFSTSKENGNSWIYIPENNSFANNVNNSKVWGTIRNNSAGFNENEYSYLNTQIFDLTKLERPMIAFDMWLDIENLNRAGAIVEYSIEDGGENTYMTLGASDEPLNWYNISNSRDIGGEASNPNQYAWTFEANEEWKWKRVAYPLDELKENNAVFLRITFRGSTNDSAKGMAVDNFFIGERTKNVLVENFTNMNSDDFNESIDTLNKFLNDPFLGEDIIPLQFHTTYPRPDALSRRNSLELDSRATIYSINSSSVYVFDGKRMSDLLFNEEYQKEIRARSLIDAKAADPKTNIEITVDNSVDEFTVKFDADIVIDTAIANNQELAVYYFVVEKFALNADETDTIGQNVVIKTLPDINGHILGEDIAFVEDSYEWKVKGINNESQLAIVTVIQDLNTNEVIQTTITDIEDAKLESSILSNEEQFDLGKINIYPNPSRDKFIIELPADHNEEIEYIIMDNVGKIIKSRTIQQGEQKHELHLNGLSSGMYHILFEDGSGNISKKKIVLID